ncbi:MAG: Eco57I restriction-modification methylase domain-containing protein, partial [Dictyoglomus sp.]|nr:Eco57I restriction-modification methylase domain-containing protein [Dictyoglomus sp.]MDW8189332.1 Eco57I restriction-modification methylase domain-containing protein [Dictyoglomus sp.]
KNQIKDLLFKKAEYEKETADKVLSFDVFSQTATADWFDPEWMFGVEDGFNIAIGNPPYVRQEKIKELKPMLQHQLYETFVSTSDLYVYFYEKGYNLLKNSGILCLISSNKWLRAKYGEKLRKFLREKTKIIKIIDFRGFSVFEQTVDTCIVLCRKEIPNANFEVEFVNVPSNLKGYEEC